ALRRTRPAMLVANDLFGTGAFALVVKLAEHLPRDPEEEDSAGEDQSYDLQQLADDKREDDSQHERREHADHDDLAPLRDRKAGRQRSNDNRIVARKNDVDHQDLKEGGNRRRGDHRAEVHAPALVEAKHMPQAQYV